MNVPAEAVTPSDRFNRVIDVLARPLTRPLGWLWARGFRFLMLIDAVVLFASMVVINIARFGTNWPTYSFGFYMVGFSTATAIHLLVNYFSGLYEREPRLGSRPWLPRVALAMSIGVALDGLAALLFDRYLMPRLNLLLLVAVGTLLLTLTRGLSRILATRRRGPSRVVLVGSGTECDRARRYLNLKTSRAAVMSEIQAITDAVREVERHGASDVLLLELEAFATGFPEPLMTLDQRGVSVHQRVSAAETLLGLSAVREIAGIPFTRLRLNALASHQMRLKRMFDLTVVVVSSPIWLTIIGLVAVYSRITAGTGVIFRQERVGHQGKTFTLLKFRTMVHNAEQLSGPVLATANDSRVLPTLKWLRISRLDEMPQLINVLLGQMSLVGPRPERPEFVDRLRIDIPAYERRHQLPPGLTGLAQTRGRYDTDPAHKLGYDLQYLVNWSLLLDAEIIAATFGKFILSESRNI